MAIESTSAGASAPTAAPAAAAPAAAPAGAASAAAPVTGAGSGVTAAAIPAAPTPNPGETNLAFLNRTIEYKTSLEKGGGSDAPAAADEEDADGEHALPSVASIDLTKVKDGDKTADTADDADGSEADNAAKPDAADGDADADGLDDFDETPGPLSPKELNNQLQAIPELASVLEAHPELKNSLFAASRMAAETAAYKEVFASPAQAKVAAAGNAEFSTLSDLVTSIDKPEDAQGFYGRLMELSVIRDEDGNPVIDPASGKPVSDGTVGRLIHHTGALFLNHFEQIAETKGNPELAAAVEVLRSAAFGGDKPATNDDLTEDQQARARDLDTREKALKEQAQQTQAATVREFNQSVTSAIDASTNASIDSFLSRTDLPEADRREVADKIITRLYELVVANPQFQREQDELMRRKMGDKTRTERIALGKRYVHDVFTSVAKEEVAKKGAKILARQNKAAAAQAARVEASRSEAPGALRTAAPAAPATADAQVKQAYATLAEKNGGRQPSFAQVLDEVRRMKG